MPIPRRDVVDLHLLLMDDDAAVVDGLQRGLRSLCPQWAVRTTTSIREACGIIKAHAADIDVVVADFQMPEATGDMLLSAIRTDHPSIIRIILSGALTISMIKEQARTAEHILCKPCLPELLRDTIREAYAERIEAEHRFRGHPSAS